MARNTNGRSSIYEGTDGYWHGWVTIGVKADGSPDRRHRMASSKTKVTEKVQELERKRDQGKVAQTGKKPFVADWIQTWLNDIAPRSASESTIESVYRPRLEIWVSPRIGKHRIDKLKPEHLDALYLEISKEGLSDKSVSMTHQMVSRLLKMAHRRGLVTENVAKLVESPTFRDTEIEPFSQEDARAFLVETESRRNSARWSVAFAMGLRQSEALGMRWEYLDLDQKKLRIWQLKRRRFSHGCKDPEECNKDRHRQDCRIGCRNHARYCPERTGGNWVFRAPKGGKTRTGDIPDPLIPQLRAQKAAQAAERLAAGDHWEDWGLVFADPLGRPINPRQDWAEFKDLLQTLGFNDARPHDARHTAATLLLEQGVDVSVVQEILGHASLAVTKRYTHVTKKLTQAAAEQIGKALWG